MSRATTGLQGLIATRWAAMAERERRWLAFGLIVIVLAIIWWVALAPALATLRSAPARHVLLDAQLQRMQALQAQATSLQSQPKLRFDEALAALEASIKQRLGGAATLAVVGERVTVTLKGVPADALAQWLVLVRVNARATLSDARLARSAATAGASAAAMWDGSVVLALPPR